MGLMIASKMTFLPGPWNHSTFSLYHLSGLQLILDDPNLFDGFPDLFGKNQISLCSPIFQLGDDFLSVFF